MNLPKSIPESQRYVVWAFPALIAFGVFRLPFASLAGFVAIVVSILVVLTGWLSFAIVPQKLYNDVLFACDLGLLSSYGLFIYFGGRLTGHLSSADIAICVVSATIFFFYALWDFSALLATDTRAAASAMHFKRFGFICLLVGIVFVALAIVSSQVESAEVVESWWTTALRLLWLLVWACVLVWWHYGRIRAAIEDGRDRN